MTRDEIAAAFNVRTSDVTAAVRYLYLRGWIGPEGTRESARGKQVEVLRYYTFVERWKGLLTAEQRALSEHQLRMEL
jgi:hypothetical protein